MKVLTDKVRVLLGWAVLIMVALTLGLWGFNAYSSGMTSGDAVLLGLPLILIIGFGVYFFNRHKEAASGGVIEDERSRKILESSFARAYLLSIYWLLAMGFFSDSLGLESLSVSTITGIGILGMAVLFGLCYLYTSKFDSSIES
ncbi:hypothetical protein JW721_00585 [Candidatus Micrarchaeota archaeon]|nr:hypothetical protein [Candidatus Micrarchaeota archaeon]